MKKNVKKKRKRILNAGLKALLAGAETSAAIKIPAAFISELAGLPEDKQKVLAELSQDRFNPSNIRSALRVTPLLRSLSHHHNALFIS